MSPLRPRASRFEPGMGRVSLVTAQSLSQPNTPLKARKQHHRHVRTIKGHELNGLVAIAMRSSRRSHYETGGMAIAFTIAFVQQQRSTPFAGSACGKPLGGLLCLTS